MKLNFEELPQATAFLLEKVEELTISINEMKQLLKRQTTAKEEMIGINEACEILSLAKPTVYALVQANKIPYYQPGKMLKFKRTELMEWMEKSRKKPIDKESRKHSKKCTFYTLRFGCSFAAVNTIKPQLL